jgi:hypothetical protein
VFESPVGLTAGALNDVHVSGQGNVGAESVYEYRSGGVMSRR